MICTNCGIELSGDTKFCHECGAPTNVKVIAVKEVVKEEEEDIIYNIKVEEEPIDLEPLTKLVLHYGVMSSVSIGHFVLEEKDGVVLFSCDYFEYINKEFVPIIHEEVPVDPSYIQKLRNYAKEEDYIHIKPHDPSAPEGPTVPQFMDAGSSSMILVWGSHKYLSVFGARMPSAKALTKFFKGIAERITKQEI